MKKLLFFILCFSAICGFNVLADDTVSYRQPAAGQESDPIVGAINGIVKADGAGNISPAQAGTDYLAPNGSAANLTDFPTLNQNTTGTAANLSGTPALPNGTTATTQAASDNSTKLATTAYADAKVADSINDGTTAVAPSQNAVYDALAAKATETTWGDYSTSSTVVGWSSFTNKQIYYKKIGNIVFVVFNIQGTSNSTSTSFTVPYSSNLGTTINIPIRIRDNGGAGTTGELSFYEGTKVTLYRDLGESLWTNSGTKVTIGQFWYEAAS